MKDTKTNEYGMLIINSKDNKYDKKKAKLLYCNIIKIIKLTNKYNNRITDEI